MEQKHFIALVTEYLFYEENKHMRVGSFYTPVNLWWPLACAGED
jgi:hypothetical protein